MKFYSTRNKEKRVDFEEAVMRSLSSDGGLYMPAYIPVLKDSFFDTLRNKSFVDIATEISNLWIDDIPEDTIYDLIVKAFDFPAPLKHVHDNIFCLELYHGPSMAFKDFGARFMAQFMSHFNRASDKALNILVATSGDTGGAVASGFHKVEGIQVTIFFPSGKISEIQEKQLTTWGDNIKAVEVNGTFDDCQRIVKEAFLDADLNSRLKLGSANSINIARLLPQSFYYFEAYKQLRNQDKGVVFSVPSGNFGNLTAGLMAKKMGLPISKLIAATNINDVVPEYLLSGEYKPRPSIETISNAMDVGNPSNFERIMDLYGSTWNNVIKDMIGFSLNDNETKKTIKHVKDNHDYLMDPHGAIGYRALNPDLEGPNYEENCVFLETAHPGKFISAVEDAIGQVVATHPQLEAFLSKPSNASSISTDFSEAKDWMFSNLC
jgi:threonine synthase